MLARILLRNWPFTQKSIKYLYIEDVYGILLSIKWSKYRIITISLKSSEIHGREHRYEKYMCISMGAKFKRLCFYKLGSQERQSFWYIKTISSEFHKFFTCLLRKGQIINLFGKFLIYFLTIKAFLNKNHQYLIYYQANFTKNRRNNGL